MWYFAVYDDAAHVTVSVVSFDMPTVSVVSFDIAGTLKRKVVVALPASAGPLTSRESLEVFAADSVSR